MYASLNLGVRIKLHKAPFKVYNNPINDIAKLLNARIIDESNGENFQSIIPINEMLTKGFISMPTITKDLLFKVEYTDDKEKLYPHLLNKKDNGFCIELGELGKYKNLHWKFQEEWRYILTIIPLNLNQPVKKSLENFQLIIKRISLGLENQPFPYYDMKLSDEAFSQMEITLSPRISAGNRTIVESLVEKYNPSTIISESHLVGLI